MAKNYTVRKDGRLQKKVKINGKYKTIYGKTPTELKIKIEEFNKLKYTNQLSDNTYTIAQWADKWLKTYKNNVEKRTYQGYESYIRLYINPYIGLIHLDKLKQTDIMNLLNKLDEKGITKSKISTLQTINQFLEKAVDNDLIQKNVCRGIKLKRYKSPEKTPLSNDIVDKLKLLSNDDDDCFMILFLIYTGLRRQELVPLTINDIDLKNKTITINKAVYFNHNQPNLKTTKNNENRIIPIFDIIYDRLSLLIKNRNKYIFVNNNGTIMSEQSLRRKLQKVIKLLNQNESHKIKFSYHQCRHTFITLLYKAGIDVKQAQAWSGHKDIRVLLDIYTHLDKEQNSLAIDKVNNFFNN